VITEEGTTGALRRERSRGKGTKTVNAYSTLLLGVAILAIVMTLMVVLSRLLRPRLDNPETANDSRHADSFTMDDGAHTVVHLDDVNLEKF
jgi:hypothetical protein